MKIKYPQYSTLPTLSLLLLGAMGGACNSSAAAPAPETQLVDTESEKAQSRGRVQSHSAPSARGLSLDEASSIADVVEAVLPSVVSITSTRTAQVQNPLQFFFGGRPQQQKQQGLGSGVILSKDGVVVTNNHVIEGAEEVLVRTSDDREYQAKVVGTDPKTDLAVLQLEGELGELVPVALGDSSTVRLGEVVLAIGNPFGVGQTVTMGIISAQGRADMGIVDYEDFIQTDAAINPGNSGGALVNMRGELIGINTAILSRGGGSVGIGFAIPTSMAAPIVEALRTEGRVSRGWLGVSLQELTKELREALGISRKEGVLIADVQKDGPGAQAGLQAGDVVLDVSGQSIDSIGQFRNLIAASGAQKKVRLTVLRDQKTQVLEVTLGELPGEEKTAPTSSGSSSSKEGKIEGLSLQSLTPELRARLRVPQEVQGVVVTRVQPGSAADQAKLRTGDVLLQVNRQPVSSPADVEKLYQATPGTKLLLVYRQGARVFLAMK